MARTPTRILIAVHCKAGWGLGLHANPNRWMLAPLWWQRWRKPASATGLGLLMSSILNSQIAAIAYPILYREGQLLDTRLVTRLDRDYADQD